MRGPISRAIPKEPWLRIAWKYLWTAKDTWLGPEQNLPAIGSIYNLTMDPYEKYDMAFNGAVSNRMPTTSPGRYAGEDNGWILSLIYPVIIDFDKSIMKYPNIKRFPGGASNDLLPILRTRPTPCPCSTRRNRRRPKRLAAECGWFDLIANTRGPLRQRRLANSCSKRIQKQNEKTMKRILTGRIPGVNGTGPRLLYKFSFSAIRDSEIILIPPESFLWPLGRYSPGPKHKDRKRRTI